MRVHLDVPKVFRPLYESKKRFIVAYGGRGSGKTQNVADKLVVQMLSDKRTNGVYLIGREHLKNLLTSSKEEIMSSARKLGVEDYFETTSSRNDITCLLNGLKFVCVGLRNEVEATHLKSFKNIYMLWIDEATNIKEKVFELVTPSVRGSDDSQIIITFNPSKRSDYIYKRFVVNTDNMTDTVYKVNYTDNPYFPAVLEQERQSYERNAPSAYKRIWLGEPGSADDIIIDPTWFKYYTILPKLQYRIMVVDTAQKDKEHNDYTVAAIFGVGEDGRLYLVDLLRAKIKAVELRKRIPAFWLKHQQCNAEIYRGQGDSFYGVLRIAYIEDAVSGTALIQEFIYNFRIPVEGIIRLKDKYTRALDAQPFIESGFVMLDANASYLNDFLLECEGFSADGSHEHDDQVDVLVDAVTKTLVEVKPFWEYI